MWLATGGPCQRAEPRGHAGGRGEGLWSGMQNSWRAEGRGEQRGGNVKTERQDGRSYKAEMGVGRFSIWPRVLAEVMGIWHLPCLAAQGASITPQPQSLTPGRLSAQQAAFSPSHSRRERLGGMVGPAGRTGSGEDPGRGLPPGVQAPIHDFLGCLLLRPSNAS